MKKVAGLLAILAIIAVFATVGSQWRSAKADVTPGLYTISGPYAVTIFAECGQNSTTPTLLANPSPVGTVAEYCIQGTGDPFAFNPLDVSAGLPGFTID